MARLPRDLSAGGEEMLESPDTVTDQDLFQLSQRVLSRRLPLVTSTRATFGIYLRWLEVHRQEPSPRTEQWSNTLRHWVFSLQDRGFSQDEVVRQVSKWKSEKGPLPSKPFRNLPTTAEIRKACEDRPNHHSWGLKWEKTETEKQEAPGTHDDWRGEVSMSSDRHDIYRPLSSESIFQGRRDYQEEALDKKERKRAEQLKFGQPPPGNYVCNRCGQKGHYLQMCPTNLDPSFDKPPSEDYRCEVCQESGAHFKSLCPKNTDPYSIAQKRRARGIAILTKGSQSWGPGSGPGSRSEWTAGLSNSPPNNHSPTPPFSKKLELLESLQDLDDKKQSLSREQSEQIGDMIREGTLKRARVESSPSGSPQKRKSLRMDGEEMGDLTMNLVNMMACTEEQEEFHKSDTELTDTEDTDANAHTRSLVPSPNLSFTLRPMEQDPTKQYPPFVRMLMRKRPEMRDLVNHLKRRTTAYDLWEQIAEQVEPSEVESTGFFSYENDKESLVSGEATSAEVPSPGYMTGSMMQLDGTCEPDSTFTSDIRTSKFTNQTTLTTNFRREKVTPEARNDTGGTLSKHTHPPSPHVMTQPIDQSVRAAAENANLDGNSKARASKVQFKQAGLEQRVITGSKSTKIEELKKFGSCFQLTTPVPDDLLPILSNDPAKRLEIRRESDAMASKYAAKLKA